MINLYRPFRGLLFCWIVVASVRATLSQSPQATTTLGGTAPLTTQTDMASDLVDGVDRFLRKKIAETVELRAKQWPSPTEDSTSAERYEQIVAPKRELLKTMIGMVDTRVKPRGFAIESKRPDLSKLGGLGSTIASGDGLAIHEVRWRVFEGVDASGLIVVSNNVRFCSVVIPDAGQMPEDLCSSNAQSVNTAVQLARQGGLVVIPTVISRHEAARNGRSVLTDQEYLYRSAFILGRHILGYQVQEVLAAVDLFEKSTPNLPVLVAGWGEGGQIALLAAAVDPRIGAACVSGHFGPRELMWSEPIHRNVHGLLTQFGDAQLAALVAPRHLIIDACAGPTVDIHGNGAAPSELSGPTVDASKQEFERAQSLLKPWGLQAMIEFVSPVGNTPAGQISDQSITKSIASLGLVVNDVRSPFQWQHAYWDSLAAREDRNQEVVAKWDRYQQRILESVHLERDQFWNKLDTSTPERFQQTVEPYREVFRKEIIGAWEDPKLPLSPRTRLIYDREDWLGYEVVLDVFDDVIAYGVLLVPKSGEPIRTRPCVVFQHGLEGRPVDTILGDHPAYHDVSVQLVKQGYVVFAPQNLYLFRDRFRTLQRKSNPLGRTLFSTIIAQHEQIVAWLGSRPEIDKTRIAFYGLSYGGKSAMRIPALVPEYCLSICSADFNDWVWKNASTTSTYSYVWTNEYEIFEFDLGRKFNYAEMATLIAPRPFMVERGHLDMVAPDERVGLEFAKVRRMYEYRLNIGERCEIEWFNGPHTINGVGTFDFLKRHLKR